MKTRLPVLFLFLVLFCCYTCFPQTAVSKGKMVIINEKARKVLPLVPSFTITGLNFTDANRDMKIEDKETDTLSFYIKNTGTVPLQELNITITEAEHTRAIIYDTTRIVQQLKFEDSVLISLPIRTDEGIKNGMTRFSICVTDTKNDSIQRAAISIPTKETLYLPAFTWINPDSILKKVDFPVFEIKGLVSSKSKLTDVNVIVNGQQLTDKTDFRVQPTDNKNEYGISSYLTLNEGYNEIKIKTLNEQGSSSVSDPRILNYYIQKIDESYVEKRLALVIGNADYANANLLPNPVNDANAISQALKDVGFTVMKYLNADYKTMDKAVADFGEKLKDFNVGLLYYAGHGVQVRGSNYLIPVDAKMKVEQDVKYDCVDAGQVLGKMEAAGTLTNIIILDACRNNPFERSWSGRATGQGSGLALMDAPVGSIVAYATAPGKTASDGTGKNSPYAEAIMQFIGVPGLSITDFFNNVGAVVAKKSNKAQTPWVASAFYGKFYFKAK